MFTDAQKTWEQTFKRAGQPYEHARLVLYRDGVSTGCGAASSAVGPFYCPADQIVYLDLSFYGDLAEQAGRGRRLRLGVRDRARDGTPRAAAARHERGGDAAPAGPARGRERAVGAPRAAGRLLRRRLGPHGLQAGRPREGRRARGPARRRRCWRRPPAESRPPASINPDSFTHGTSEQRRSWFEKGYESGDADACDTFSPISSRAVPGIRERAPRESPFLWRFLVGA